MCSLFFVILRLRDEFDYSLKSLKSYHFGPLSAVRLAAWLSINAVVKVNNVEISQAGISFKPAVVNRSITSHDITAVVQLAS